MRLDELAGKIDATLSGGDGATEVSGVAALDEAGARQVGFVSNPKYLRQLETTNAAAVIVGEKVHTDRVPLLKTKDPYYAFMRAVVALHGYRQHPHTGVHPGAHVEETATIGEGTVVYPGTYVGARVSMGRDCIVYPNVTIYDDTQIGDRVILHAGAAIGADGFGFATHGGVHHKIPQAGRVVIEDDVEIGANAAVARGAIGETRIGAGTKIDAMVIVGHGTTIGKGCILVAQVGIAGSAQIGNYVTMAGQVGVAGHLKIGDQVTIAAQAGVMGDIEDKQIVIGSPAMPAQHARRVYMIFTKLPDVVERLKQLEQRLSALEDEAGGDIHL